MNIKDLLTVYRTIDSDPRQALMAAGAVDETSYYEGLGEDKIYWIQNTKKAIRLYKNSNDTYSLRIIDNYGPKSRGEARYSAEHYGPYQYENEALKACVEIVKKYIG